MKYKISFTIVLVANRALLLYFEGSIIKMKNVSCIHCMRLVCAPDM